MRWLLALLLFAFPLIGREELVAHLKPKESLTKLYLALQCTDGSFPKEYLKELEKVLRFDFSHNGKTETTDYARSPNKVDAQIKQKRLVVTMSCEGSHKAVEGITLTGKLDTDRTALHRVHDTLLHALLNVPGIAQTRILYTLRERKGDDPLKWSSEVWAVDYDGARATALTHDNALCVTPVFIPTLDGAHADHFLYVSYKIGQPKIYAASIEEGVGRRLSYLRGNQLMPAISPKLDQIAFICDITGNPDLFVQDFSLTQGAFGKPRQVFCAKNATQGTPSFSPDGKKLAFVSNKDGTPRIYILRIPQAGASVDDLIVEMISKKMRENTSPAWSGNGKMVAYSALTAGTRQIWVYDLERKQERQITDGEGHKENPAWSPDSTHLVYNRTNERGSDLFIIDINQKKAVQITEGPGEKRFPSWESGIQS